MSTKLSPSQIRDYPTFCAGLQVNMKQNEPDCCSISVDCPQIRAMQYLRIGRKRPICPAFGRLIYTYLIIIKEIRLSVIGIRDTFYVFEWDWFRLYFL